MKKGDPYGIHRVIEPKGKLPQPAKVLNNDMSAIFDNEILIEVQTLNIDSASFTNIYKEHADMDLEKTKEIIYDIVDKQGKHMNPWTGSGGMLIGKVSQIGDALKDKIDLKIGDKIATLISLSLTPLRIDEILEIRPDMDQVDIKGKAILFESGIFAKIPDDLPEKLVLSVLDVAGAPAQTKRLSKKGMSIVVIGGTGKSGMLCLYEAKKCVGDSGKVICVGRNKNSIARIKKLEKQGVFLADEYICVDCTDAVSVMQAVNNVTNGEMADLVINTANVPDTEMASILCAKEEGTVYFFSMATSFTKAALGAEGVGRDVSMLIGNGYAKNHAEISLQIMRDCIPLKRLYEEMYA